MTKTPGFPRFSNKKPLFFVLAALCTPLLLVMLLESRFIYYPSKQVTDCPADYGLIFEETLALTTDEVQVHGWLIVPQTPPIAWLLFSHGNAGNISGRSLIAKPLVERGLGVLLYDYRGYGKSEGSPDEKGTYQDGEAMLDILFSRAAPDKIFVFGRSLGGGISYELARRHPELGGLITDATFTSMPEMASQLFPIPFLGKLLRNRYDNLEKAPHIQIPRLVMHGENDELVPFWMAERLRDATHPQARFHPIPGAGHNDTFLVGGDDYANAIRHFIDECLRQGPSR